MKIEQVDGQIVYREFTQEDVKNKALILQMLRKEDEIMHSTYGQDIYRNSLNHSLTSLMPQLIIQRAILASFGFTTDDRSVDAYRSIFRNYYISPTEYDREVLQSVTYMRENLCLYYTTPKLKIGQTAPNCLLYGLDGKSQHELYSLIRPTSRFTMLCAFSSS